MLPGVDHTTPRTIAAINPNERSAARTFSGMIKPIVASILRLPYPGGSVAASKQNRMWLCGFLPSGIF
jgi:hypothetical protein